MENDLIVVKQLPVIEEQLRRVKASVAKRVVEALSLVCTEDTYKDVKKERAALNKEFQELEARRREVKKAILAPYEAFEALYKECVSDIFTRADDELRKKIAAVEGGLKDAKRAEVLAFYNEYRESVNIPADLVPFERAQINITMSDSVKKLRERAAAFLEGIANDLRMIETLEYRDEVLVEYAKTLSAPQAALIVDERHKRMEAESRRRAEQEAARAAQAEAQAKIEAVLEEAPPVPAPAPITVPAERPAQDAPVDPHTLPFVAFRVYGTVDRLKALKNFLEDGGYYYEQC